MNTTSTRKTVKPSKLVRTIFSDNNHDETVLNATVGAYAVIKSERYGYEPILKAMSEIEYNEFEGANVVPWLRSNLYAEGGSVLSFRFGREGSPVLYLTVVRAVPNGDGPYRQLTGRARKALGQKLIATAKADLRADEADYESGTVRLWWD